MTYDWESVRAELGFTPDEEREIARIRKQQLRATDFKTVHLVNGPYKGQLVQCAKRMTHILLPEDPTVDGYIHQIHARKTDERGHVRYTFFDLRFLGRKIAIGVLGHLDDIPNEHIADLVLTESARKAWK